MSRQTEQKFNELAQWFNEAIEYQNHPDIDKRMELLLKLQQNVMWLLTYIVEDVQSLEGRGGQGGTGLWLPEQNRLDRKLRMGGDNRA